RGRKLVDGVGFTECPLLAECNDPHDQSRNALETDRATVDTTKLRSSLCSRGDTAKKSFAIGANAVSYPEEHPFPFLMLGLETNLAAEWKIDVLGLERKRANENIVVFGCARRAEQSLIPIDLCKNIDGIVVGTFGVPLVRDIQVISNNLLS